MDTTERWRVVDGILGHQYTRLSGSARMRASSAGGATWQRESMTGALPAGSSHSETRRPVRWMKRQQFTGIKARCRVFTQLIRQQVDQSSGRFTRTKGNLSVLFERTLFALKLSSWMTRLRQNSTSRFFQRQSKRSLLALSVAAVPLASSSAGNKDSRRRSTERC